jgi:cytochrome c55X
MRCSIASLMLSLALAGPVAAGEPAPARAAELRHLLIQDCGSCHGLQLRGGLGPALLPSALADRPDALLVATIIHGRHGTAMPAWRALLSEEEALWLVRSLRQGVLQ